MFGVRDLFKSIKSDKKISLDNWRYRLLHWTHGLNREGYAVYRNDDGGTYTSDERWLPKFFYTHYCPLFHMTNTLAVGLPLIVFCKIVWFFIKNITLTAIHIVKILDYRCEQFFAIVCDIYSYLSKWAKKFKRKEERKSKKPKPKKIKKQVPVIFDPRAVFASAIVGFEDIFHNRPDFASAFEYRRWSTEMFGKTYEELEDIYNKICKIFDDKEKKDRLNKEKIRKRVLFWINISQVFMKGLFNLIYLGIFLLVCFVTFVYGGSFVLGATACAYYLIHGILTIHWYKDFIHIIYWAGISIAFISSVSLSVFILYWIGKQFCIVVKKTNFQPILVPYNIVKDVTVNVLGYIGNTASSFIEFCSMFVAENCPGIEIVDKE